MKLCHSCNEVKKLSEFNRKTSSHDGRQSKCRACSKKVNKQSYQKDPSLYLKRTRTRDDRIASLINEKKNKPCHDCKHTFPPCVMDFDHLNGDEKIGSIAEMRIHGYSMAKILAEIEKCEVICSNCHRIRTYNRSLGKQSRKSTKLIK